MPPEAAAPHSEPRVFIEIGATYDNDFPPQIPPEAPAQGWIVAHVLASEGQAAAIPWQTRARGVGEDAVGELSALPHISDEAPGHVRLYLALRADAHAKVAAGHDAQLAEFHTTLVLQDQQTAVLKTKAGPATSTQTLVVTPYIVRSDDDLKRLLQCKVQARKHAVLRR